MEGKGLRRNGKEIGKGGKAGKGEIGRYKGEGTYGKET